MIVIALLAVLDGAGGPTAIARWAALKAEFLFDVFDLPHGVPRKDVFRRVLMVLKPAAFPSCFARWLRSLRTEAAAETGVQQPVLAVDGKTLPRSQDRNKGLGALHSVSVWASAYGLSLGQVACAEKSNEITAIPELPRLVDIKGAILTIDAMGAQKAIAGVLSADERWLHDLARDLVLSPHTLHGWRKKGWLHARQVGGRQPVGSVGGRLRTGPPAGLEGVPANVDPSSAIGRITETGTASRMTA